MRICIERQTFSLDRQLELFQLFSQEDFLLISQKTRCLLCNHRDKTENTTGNRLEKLSAPLHVGKVSALCMHKTLLDLLSSVLLQPKVLSLLLPVLIFKSIEIANLKIESMEIKRKDITLASERKYFSIYVKLLSPIPLIHILWHPLPFPLANPALSDTPTMLFVSLSAVFWSSREGFTGISSDGFVSLNVSGAALMWLQKSEVLTGKKWEGKGMERAWWAFGKWCIHCLHILQRLSFAARLSQWPHIQ